MEFDEIVSSAGSWELFSSPLLPSESFAGVSSSPKQMYKVNKYSKKLKESSFMLKNMSWGNCKNSYCKCLLSVIL